MAYITVWNHGSAAQRRPVQFTVPLGLSWGNLLEVGSERMIAEKQYDDGAHAVYVCPPPAAGWPGEVAPTNPDGTRTDYPVSAYSGVDPQYRFKFAEPYAADVCGSPAQWDLRFLPTLEVYQTPTDTNPIIVRPSDIKVWSQGVHPTTGLPIANGGNRHRWFCADAHNQGWHLYFYIGFDSEMAVSEFDAAVVHSDENNPSYRITCDRVVLRWPQTVKVKPRFLADGIQRENGSESTMMLRTTFTSVTYHQWAYASWAGQWRSQMGFGFSGFMLAQQPDGASTTFSDTEYANAETLHAVLDAESWDTHWLGGGSSGHGINLLHDEQLSPDYNPTVKHFWTWKRTGEASDQLAAGGCLRGEYPNTTGVQPGFGLVRGHDVLMRAVSPRDYEVAAYDNIRRPHYIWSDPNQRTAASAIYSNVAGLVMPADQPLLETSQGVPVNDYRFGKTSGSPTIPRTGSSEQNHSLYDQHSSLANSPAAFALMKRPMVWHNMILRLQWDELNGRRPNRGRNADLTGSRAIGRPFSFHAGVWEAAPGLRNRLVDLVYHPSWGYYPCLKKLTGGSGLFFINLIDSDPNTFDWPTSRMPTELPRTEDTVPKWMRAPDIRGGVQYDGHVDSNFRPSQFRFGPSANTNYPRPPSDPTQQTDKFGCAEPGWEVVGLGGLLYWWHAIDKTSGGGWLDPNSEQVTDFKEWGETGVENIVKYGVQITTTNTRRVLGLLMTYYSGQLLWSSTMSTPYPPGPSAGPAYPHPFQSEAHPLHQYCAHVNGRAETTWHMGAINWYRQFGGNEELKREAQRVWADTLAWVNTFGPNGSAVTTHLRGWYAVFFNAIAPLDPSDPNAP